MENLSRNLEKNLTRQAKPKPLKRTKKWAFFFVGENGRIISVSGMLLKCLIIISEIVLVVAVMAAVVFFYLYKNTLSKLDVSRHHLISLSDENNRIKNEKEILLAKLVLSESRIDITTEKNKEKELKNSVNKQPLTITPVQLNPQNPPELLRAGVNNTITADEAIPDQKEAVSQPDNTLRVKVDNLIVLHDTYSDTLKVKFIIKKTDPNLESISGRTFVILKPDSPDKDKWLIMPPADVIAGKPSPIKRGQYFSIARFKSIDFQVNNVIDPLQFTNVKIFVFATTGDLLFEKGFPIKIKEMLNE